MDLDLLKLIQVYGVPENLHSTTPENISPFQNCQYFDNYAAGVNTAGNLEIDLTESQWNELRDLHYGLTQQYHTPVQPRKSNPRKQKSKCAKTNTTTGTNKKRVRAEYGSAQLAKRQNGFNENIYLQHTPHRIDQTHNLNLNEQQIWFHNSRMNSRIGGRNMAQTPQNMPPETSSLSYRFPCNSRNFQTPQAAPLNRDQYRFLQHRDLVFHPYVNSRTNRPNQWTSQMMYNQCPNPLLAERIQLPQNGNNAAEWLQHSYPYGEAQLSYNYQHFY